MFSLLKRAHKQPVNSPLTYKIAIKNMWQSKPGETCDPANALIGFRTLSSALNAANGEQAKNERKRKKKGGGMHGPGRGERFRNSSCKAAE